MIPLYVVGGLFVLAGVCIGLSAWIDERHCDDLNRPEDDQCREVR